MYRSHGGSKQRIAYPVVRPSASHMCWPCSAHSRYGHSAPQNSFWLSKQQAVTAFLVGSWKIRTDGERWRKVRALGFFPAGLSYLQSTR